VHQLFSINNSRNRGGPGNAHESLQPLARRPRGEIFRPSDTAMAADFGNAFPAGADSGTRTRDCTKFCRWPDWSSRRCNISEPAYGVRRARLCSVALDNAGYDFTPLLTCRDVPCRSVDWLADIGALPTRCARYDY